MYRISSLFYYRIVFMAELLIAEAIFTFRLKKRKNFPLRVALCILVAISFAFALPIIEYSAAYCSLMFFIMYAFTLPLMMICFDEGWKIILFCSVAAYTTQHIAYEFYDLVQCAFSFGGGMPGNIYTSSDKLAFFKDPVSQIVFFAGHAVIYWVMLVTFGVKVRGGSEMQLRSTTVFFLMMAIALIDIVASSLVTYYGYSPYNKFSVLLLAAYNIACSLFTMVFQFELIIRKKLQSELDMEKRLRRLEKEQYALSKENIDLINLKCHDMKYRIRAIGKESSLDEKAVKEIENLINVYDSSFSTDNAALDVILTEKSFACRKEGVKLSCIVARGALKFMSESDIYSLFGNALDNAVEAVKEVEADKKFIDVSVKITGDMTVITVNNYYAHSLTFMDGLPATTKEEKDYHGFGMKSIAEIVARYDGELSISAEDDIFGLKILFFNADTPAKEQEKPLG